MNDSFLTSRLLPLCLILAMAACGRDEAHVMATQPVANSVSAPRLLPCETALTLDHVVAAQPDVSRLRRDAAVSADPAILENLAWRYFAHAGDGDDAGALFLAGQTIQCMLERDPDSQPALILRAHHLHQNHDFTGAGSLAARLVRERGSWLDHAVLGDALVEQGRLERAAEAYQAMVDLKPGAGSFGRIARLRWLGGDLEGAMEMIILAIRAQDPRDGPAAAWWRTELAGYLLQAGNLAAGLSVVEQALELDARNHRARYLHGRLMYERGDIGAAIADIRSAASMSQNPEYLRTLVDLLRETGARLEANRIRNRILESGHRYDRRETALFIAADEADDAARLETAMRLLRQEMSRRQDPFTLDAMAWVNFLGGDLSAAQEMMSRATATGASHPRISYHGAAIALAVGDEARAQALISAAQAGSRLLQPSERRHLDRLSRSLSTRA